MMLNLKRCITYLTEILITKFEIPIVMHNALNYDFHLIVINLVNNCDSIDYDCLGENTEKWISFFDFYQHKY